MEGFIIIISLAASILCGVVLYKAIIATCNITEEMVACIRDIRYTLNTIQRILKEKE